eukprot:1969587-Amphidinium_carterae.1
MGRIVRTSLHNQEEFMQEITQIAHRSNSPSCHGGLPSMACMMSRDLSSLARTSPTCMYEQARAPLLLEFIAVKPSSLYACYGGKRLIALPKIKAFIPSEACQAAL